MFLLFHLSQPEDGLEIIGSLVDDIGVQIPGTLTHGGRRFPETEFPYITYTQL
jgi:hypothetical protein